jgi:hypothetical protein
MVRKDTQGEKWFVGHEPRRKRVDAKDRNVNVSVFCAIRLNLLIDGVVPYTK